MKNIIQKITVFAVSAVMCLSLTGCGSSSSNLIGKPRAKEIALSDAGFPERWVIELKAKADRSNGEHVYNVSFINATTIYEYVIDGETGAIIDSQTEPLFGNE